MYRVVFLLLLAQLTQLIKAIFVSYWLTWVTMLILFLFTLAVWIFLMRVHTINPSIIQEDRHRDEAVTHSGLISWWRNYKHPMTIDSALKEEVTSNALYGPTRLSASTAYGPTRLSVSNFGDWSKTKGHYRKLKEPIGPDSKHHWIATDDGALPKDIYTPINGINAQVSPQELYLMNQLGGSITGYQSMYPSQQYPSNPLQVQFHYYAPPTVSKTLDRKRII